MTYRICFILLSLTALLAAAAHADLGDILGAALDRKTQEEAARAAEAKDSPDES